MLACGPAIVLSSHQVLLRDGTGFEERCPIVRGVGDAVEKNAVGGALRRDRSAPGRRCLELRAGDAEGIDDLIDGKRHGSDPV